MADNKIEIVVGAKDNASSVFESLKGKLAAVSVAIAGYFGYSLFSNAVKGAADLEAGMSRVQAASNASAEEMAALKAAAVDAGATTKYTATQAAAALETLVKAGLSSKDAITSLVPVLNLAQAGDVDLATSADYVTKAVKGMGLQFTDAGRVADVLAMGANASSTSVRGLAEAMSYAAPVAKAAGLSLEQTVSIMGKFADGGIDASRAGTALNEVLSQFIDPSSNFRKELAGAGIVTSNFDTALRGLAAAGKKGESAILAVGLNAGPAFRSLLNQGIASLDELKGKLDASGGSAAKTAAIMEGNLKGSFSGLASAWDTVKIALGEPVLPVLTDAVKQLTAGISGAVSNGTIGQFGTSIATAFKSAIEWVKGFVAAVDFKVVSAQLQEFAAKIGNTMAELGKKATEAGNVVQLVYGVMTGGVNTVLSAIYALGGGFAGVAAGIQNGLAALYEATSKITFGNLSRQYKEIAAEIRLSADATTASAQALGQKSQQAFDAAANAGQIAKTAYLALADSARESIPAQNISAAAIKNVAEQLGKMGDAASTSAQKQIEAVAKTIESVAKLKTEYEAAIAAGDIQLAAQKQQQMRDELAKTTGQAKITKDALQSAFESLGIVSQAKLKESAEAAQNLFDILKASGQATALDLKNAFGVLAQRTLEAAGAVGSTAREAAQATLAAKGAAEGLSVTFDSAGKAIVRAMGQGGAAVDGLTDSIKISAEALKAQEDAFDRMEMRYKLRADYTERQIALEERELALLERKDALERKRLAIDKDGFSVDKSGNRIVATESQAQLDQRVGNKYGAALATDQRAIRASNVQIQLDQIRAGNLPGANTPDVTALLAELGKLESELSAVRSGRTVTASTLPAAASQSSTYLVRVELGNGQGGSFKAASDSDARAATELIKQLGSAKLAAGY